MKTCIIASLFILLVSSMMVQGEIGDPYSDEGCGETRGCFDCRESVSTCAVNVAWKPDREEGVVKFTLWGSKTGNETHVSVGITPTQNMFNADVYSCISNGTGGVLVRSWNPLSGRSTQPRTLIGVYDQEISMVDGEIRCQFYRNMSLANGDDQFFNISGDNAYYLILSAGGASGESISGHSPQDRGVSSSSLILSQLPAGDAEPEVPIYSEDECGETRGCFDCRDSVSTCAVNVAWEPDREEGVIKFTLWGSKTGNEAHVSMGITSTANMFNADVYSCIHDGDRGVLVRSWNPLSGRTTQPRTLIGVSKQQVSMVDGEIRCQFYRNMSLANGDDQFFNISGDNAYYLILSAGGASGESINGHTREDRGVSSSTLILSQVSAGNAGRYGIWTLIVSLAVAFRVSKN